MATTVRVPSHERWVDTQVDVTAGARLQLAATGIWVDFYIPCSADGYAASLFYKAGKLPRINDSERYFRLMGRIGDASGPPRFPDTALDPSDPNGTFIVGRSASYSALRPGRLYVFANDGLDRYGNNWGAVQLAIDLR